MEDVRIEHRYNASHFKLDNHYENVYQMLLITNGRIRYRVGNKTYETGRGGVIVLNTLEEHELEVLEYPYERYLIRVQPDFFQNEVKYPEVIAAFIKRPPNFSHLLTVSEPIWNYLYDIVLEMEREYPYLKESHGSVINFASGAGLFGNFGQSAYAAAKEGIRGLSRVAATEWGKDGINVNIVCPLAWTAKLEQFQQAYPDAFKANVKMPPMGHYGNAETEIGRVCVQLASPDFKFMSGETLTLEGGMGQRP